MYLLYTFESTSIYNDILCDYLSIYVFKAGILHTTCNKNGGKKYAIATTHAIPINVTTPNENIAGCFANTKTPIPINIINAESIIDCLY